MFNNGEIDDISSEIQERYQSSTLLQEAFAPPQFETLDLAGPDDVYLTDYTKDAPASGYKAGPNNQFFRTMELLRAHGHYSFLMESDCVPIRAGWLSRLQKILSSSENAWIIGSAYRGVHTMDNLYKRHINGNAVYATGDPAFQDFISEVWKPALKDIIRDFNPRIAYDCALEIMLNHMDSMKRNNRKWARAKTYLHKFRYTDFIQNISAKRDITESPEDLPFSIYNDSFDTYILHGRIFSDALHQMRIDGLLPHPSNLRIAPN